MKGTTLADYTAKIRQLVRATPQQVFIRTRHIEIDRIWREISETDVRKVLSNGTVEVIRQEDLTIFWRGRDVDGRLIELQCSFMTEDAVDTLVVNDAFILRIGTAYEPEKNDAKARREWLKSHSDYEPAPPDRVRKKVLVLSTRRKDK